MKLNLGCGDDVRKGWVNIDDGDLPGVTRWNLSDGLPKSCSANVSEIAALNVLEHLPHYHSIPLLKQCFIALVKGGTLTIQVPCFEALITRPMEMRDRIAWVYGGQDTPQGKSPTTERIRRERPDLFCHRWGWTSDTLREDLEKIGFVKVKVTPTGLNMTAVASKP